MKSKDHRKDESHWAWFNGQKKTFVMNNTIILDHHGIFIYIDT